MTSNNYAAAEEIGGRSQRIASGLDRDHDDARIALEEASYMIHTLLARCREQDVREKELRANIAKLEAALAGARGFMDRIEGEIQCAASRGDGVSSEWLLKRAKAIRAAKEKK